MFGSEIKAILEHPDVPRAMDLQSMYHYLGYEFVPGPATMFQGIRKLPPGTIARVRGGRLEIEPYWELRFEDSPDDAEALARRVRETLRDSVHAWMMSDVPEGVFLSGGLDSTAVLAFAREATTGPLPTFTLGYDDPTFSEWEYAREAARYYGTEHREIRVAPGHARRDRAGRLAPRRADDRSLGGAALPPVPGGAPRRHRLPVGRGRRRGVRRLRPVHRVEGGRLYRMLPRALRRGVIEPLVTRLPDQEQKKGPVVVLRRFIEGARLDPDGLHMRWQYFGSDALDQRLFRDTVLRSVDRDRFAPIRQAAARCNSDRQLDREIFVDTRFTMPDSVLMKVDKMSMAHALEMRVPLLDHHLIELAATIPPAPQVPGLPDARHLPAGARGRAAAEDPRAAASRATACRSSSGSGTSSATTWCSCSGAPRWCAHYLDPAGVEALIAEHLARRANHNHTLWALINLTLWHRRFIEGV